MALGWEVWDTFSSQLYLEGGSHQLISKDKIVSGASQSLLDGILGLANSVQGKRRGLPPVSRGKLQERGQTLHISRVPPDLP